MTTGGSGFTHGEDFVAARLSIDIPSDGIASLRELTQEVERFRVAAESAARSEDNFERYLSLTAEAADRATVALERAADVHQRLATGAPSGGTVPPRYVDPFAGVEAGTGRTPTTAPDVQNQIDALRERDPRAYLNMQAARGNLAAGDVSPGSEEQLAQTAARVHERDRHNAEHYQQNPAAQHIPRGGEGGLRQHIGQGAPITQQVLSEMGPGGARASAAAPGGVIEPAAVEGLEGGALAGLADKASKRGSAAGGVEDASPSQPKRKSAAVGEEDAVGGLRQQVGQGAGIAQQVLSELGPGGSYPGGAGLALRGLNAASQMGGAAGADSALAGLAKGAGVAGLGLTAGLGGFGLAQKGGEIYQDFKNQGSVRGGGAAEGFGYEMQIRTLAMNPFLSTEQSRQIIQAGLTEGYTGKAYDSVTSFLAANLKEMNMQVGESVALLRKNVNEGGQSIEGLAANLGVLKEMSKTGARSLPELQQGFEATSSTLINAGVPGPAAERAAMVAGRVFADDQALKGTFEEGVQTMATSLSGQAFLKIYGGLDLPPGTLPQMIPLIAGDQLPRATESVLKRYALQFYTAAGRPPLDPANPRYGQALVQFQMFAQRLGQPWSSNMQQVKRYFDAYATGKDLVGEAERDTDKATQQQTSVQDKGVGMATFPHGFGLGSIGESFKALGGITADLATTNPVEAARRAPGRLDKIPDAGRRYDIPMLTQIEGVYGQGGFEVLDENGKPVKLNRSDREQMDKLSGGEYKWRPKGETGPGTTLSQTPQNLTKERMTEVSGSVQIGLTPEAQKLLQVQGPNPARLTPHEQKANAGYGDSTMNNAAPGDDVITRGRGGW